MLALDMVMLGSEQLELFAGIQASTELVYPPVMKRAETRVNRTCPQRFNGFTDCKMCRYLLIDNIPFLAATKELCIIPNMKNNAK